MSETATTHGAVEHRRVVIVGSGFAGLCAAIKLRQEGRHDFVVLEKADDVGGTWRENTYPGAACDVPARLYSYSFEARQDWTRPYAEQPEILRYLQRCADKYGVTEHLRFGTEVGSASFDEYTGRWTVTTTQGTQFTADVLILGTGQLNRPSFPTIVGRDDFQGAQFHSAEWNHDFDLRGKRVAVIGNGASAIQFVPKIAPHVDLLNIFQRSANWILPKMDEEYSERSRRLLRFGPISWAHRVHLYWQREARFRGFVSEEAARKREKIANAFLDSQVPDPELRATLTPDYPSGCKRVLISNEYYPALNRPNVNVIDDAIVRLTERGVACADGTEYEVDAVIYATGFQATSFLAPIDIRGRAGKALHETWRDGAEAYLGMTVPGFPNMFVLYGPNTNLGHNSVVSMIESQVRYVVRSLDLLDNKGADWLELSPSAMHRYSRRLARSLERTVWQAGCQSWYKTAEGKITNNWPRQAFTYWLQTRGSRLGEFEAGSVPAAAAPSADRVGADAG